MTKIDQHFQKTKKRLFFYFTQCLLSLQQRLCQKKKIIDRINKIFLRLL